jgi:cyclase
LKACTFYSFYEKGRKSFKGERSKMTNEALYRSAYFTLYKVRKGIYAAIATKASGALANAGIIDLGDLTIVFDTFQSPLAAAHLRETAEALTGKKVSFVVNSHWHFDHVLGNQAFHDALVISTARTREIMADRVSAFLNIVKRNPNYPTLLKKEASRTNDYGRRRELLQNAGDAAHLVTHADDLRTVLPHTTTDEMCIHGTQREAVLINSGRCHSEEDLVLYLPQDGVLFAGDVVFSECHPSCKNGDIKTWNEALTHISSMDVDVIIPGHGDICSLEQIGEMKQYFKDMQRTARAITAWNGDIENERIPERYALWESPSIYYTNLAALCEASSAQEESDIK